MKKIGLILFVAFFILSSSFISAFSYSISEVSRPSSKPYQGDIIELTAKVTASHGNVCSITCTWRTDNYDGNVGNPEPLAKDQYKTFNFKVFVKGTGGVSSDTLTVTCTRILSPTCWGGSPDSIPEEPISFSFNYNGDTTCTTSICQGTSKSCEDCQSAASDCPCSTGTKCMFDVSRQKDTRGCTTYCGNKIKETSYETCSNCPADMGKCDGLACMTGSECEGRYCVHEKCWNKPYKEGDGFCDINLGENCGNSNDCACKGSLEKCESGVCKTWCGNSNCEESEKGVCKADCKWCGDGSCDSSQKESCKTCESDCGVCESTSVNQEIQEKTQEVVQSGLKEVSDKQKIVTFSGIGAIIFVILGYIVFKIIRGRKTDKNDTNKIEQEIESSKNICKKCGHKLNTKSLFCKKCGHKRLK